MTLSVRGKPVDVTATEFRLLHFLASHPGKVYTRDQVLEFLPAAPQGASLARSA